MKEPREEILAFAVELARAAEKEILPRYQRCAVELKDDGSEVTEADRRAEAVIREQIARRYPDHAVLGEELGGESSIRSSRQWVIDPVDGTTWFALGTPLFGTLVAFLEDGEPVVGVIHLPVLGEMVYAGLGLGCWFKRGDARAERLRVRAAAPLSEAFVSASGVHGSDIHPPPLDEPYRLRAVLQRAGKFRFCGDCLQHALVCRGNLHAAIDTVMQPWDVAALVPCIEEAGGVVTNLEGQRAGVVFGGSLLTSCAPALHEELLGQLRAPVDNSVDARD